MEQVFFPQNFDFEDMYKPSGKHGEIYDNANQSRDIHLPAGY